MASILRLGSLRFAAIAALALAILAVAQTANAGPPFQTDDPEPVDFRHYEFYTFGSALGTGAEMDTVGPAFEFNWGILPNTQFHIVVPAAAIFPANNPVFLPAGAGGRAFGLGDIEIGVKLRLIQETKHRPMVGTFTMLEAPAGNANLGLGVGKTWYKLPVWVQKSFGPWTTYGGAGETVVPQDGFNNFPYGGILAQRDLGKKWTLGAEVFSHGGEGIISPERNPATLIDAGGYYYIHNPGFQILFAYGHSVTHTAETYAYFGLYWTWGNSKSDKNADKAFLREAAHPQIPGIL